MPLVIFYLLLLVVYLVSWWASAHSPSPNHVPELVTRMSALVGLLAALGAALQKASLTVYFWVQKLLIRLSPDSTSRWRFSARYDGEFADDTVSALVTHLTGPDFRFKTRVASKDMVSAEVEIDDTLLLSVQFEPAHLSHQPQDTVTVVSRVMEVSYGHAKKKIETQIVPVLTAIDNVLRAANSSFELDVQFLRKNPFFAVYIAHLRPEQVQDYRVVLHVDGSHPTGKAEKVEITKERVHVTAKSASAFKSMAEQFVLLSPDLNMLRADH